MLTVPASTNSRSASGLAKFLRWKLGNLGCKPGMQTVQNCPRQRLCCSQASSPTRSAPPSGGRSRCHRGLYGDGQMFFRKSTFFDSAQHADGSNNTQLEPTDLFGHSHQDVLEVALIARRSRFYAGTRYRKRGLNVDGQVVTRHRVM